jgi:hypothetical protein
MGHVQQADGFSTVIRSNKNDSVAKLNLYVTERLEILDG